MSGSVATYFFLGAVLFLFWRDHKLRPMTSAALWVPFLWFGIIGTRAVTYYFNTQEQMRSVDMNVDGSPVDAMCYGALLLAAIVILARRKIDWGAIVRGNTLVFMFFAYCLLSSLWSDWTLVAVKRWVKDLGQVLMVLVILTETDRAAAIRALLVRYAYIALPISVLFIKYLPDYGRYYDRWLFTPMYRGVGMDKNALGAAVALACVALVWDLVERAKRPEPAPAGDAAARAKVPGAPLTAAEALAKRRQKQEAGAARVGDWIDMTTRVMLFLMGLWLLDKADSTNAKLCLAMGLALVLVFRRSMLKELKFIRRLGWVFFAVLFVGALVYFTPLLDTILIAMGEDPTLTGRTDLWHDLIAIQDAPLIGSGYQTFWLEDYINTLWQKYDFKPNNAHNGYLETYLNLGLIGFVLLLSALVVSVVRLRRELLARAPASALMFALLAIALFYNWSEAMFSTITSMWFVTLLAVVQYDPAAVARRAPARHYAANKLKTVGSK
jgi:O-antigen ligase